MKKNNNNRQCKFRRVVVFVPEKGFFPHYLKAAVQFAHFFAASITLFVSAKFVSERPRKGDFYREFLEAQSFQHGILWNMQVYEDSIAMILKRLSPAEDFVVALRDDNFALTGDILQNAPAPVLVIPKFYDQPFQQVLLASVGGRLNDRAIGIAVILGTFGRCKVEVLTIGSSPSPALRMAHEKTKYFLDICKVKANYQMLRGHSKTAILKNCESKRINLLVLGAKETEQWKDHRFRSFSEAVAEETSCPVLVVK